MPGSVSALEKCCETCMFHLKGYCTAEPTERRIIPTEYLNNKCFCRFYTSRLTGQRLFS